MNLILPRYKAPFIDKTSTNTSLKILATKDPNANVKRTRLNRDDRRNHLLDSTLQVITISGLNSFTMELLAKEAGVSSPLIYKYFNTRLSLLQELLVREYSRFISELDECLNETKNYQEIIRLFVTLNFDQYSNGNVLQILKSEPEIYAVLHEEDRKNSLRISRFLVDSLLSSYDLPYEKAQFVTKMASAASIAAAELCVHKNVDREEMISETIHFIFNGISAFRR